MAGTRASRDEAGRRVLKRAGSTTRAGGRCSPPTTPGAPPPASGSPRVCRGARSVERADLMFRNAIGNCGQRAGIAARCECVLFQDQPVGCIVSALGRRGDAEPVRFNSRGVATGQVAVPIVIVGDGLDRPGRAHPSHRGQRRCAAPHARLLLHIEACLRWNHERVTCAPSAVNGANTTATGRAIAASHLIFGMVVPRF